ncbi:MAG: PhoH-like protein [Candidatus Omnitrophica bacterium ADurb.Bin205]|nr:MAG: PhoH-like protein [Candidatus Omnitrophica bacterium ADurb.Bin205]
MDKIIKIQSHEQAHALCGMHDSNIRLIEKEFKVKIALRGEHLKISGTATNIKKAEPAVNSFLNNSRFLPISTRQIGPKTSGQREYVNAIKEFDIVFGVGPAGTGKTYLAMASAVEALKKQEVRRIILTRPAIEAGESLGFLPGDMHDKISPYLRPLYDALYDMMDAERIEKYLENGIIEVAPLAYMRGRTLNDAFIILDEAQNCTAEQMKMFLTRLGFDSKAVITGDMTQSDLPHGKPIGLLQAQDILSGIKEIKFIYFTGKDVVRHALVQRIIEAYDKTAKTS